MVRGRGKKGNNKIAKKKQSKKDKGMGYCLWKFKEGTSPEKIEEFAQELSATDADNRYINVSVNQSPEGDHVVSFSFTLEKWENLFWFERGAKDVSRKILGDEFCSLEMFEVHYENSLGPVGTSITNYAH